MINKVKYIKFLLVLFVGLCSMNKAFAQYTEYEVKAAYIFSFVKFIDWKNAKINNQDTVVLGIYKNDPFGVTIEDIMNGRTSKGKHWKIIRIDNVKQVDKCNLVFVSEVSKYDLNLLLKRIQNKPIISIGDGISDFCEIGGMINFTSQYSANQFEINNKLANKNGIIINPKLLKLAKIVSYNDREF